MLSYLRQSVAAILVVGEIVCHIGNRTTVGGVVTTRSYFGTVCQTMNKCFHAAINYQESGSSGDADFYELILTCL